MIETTYSNPAVNTSSKFLSKVFLYMFIALAITAATSAVIGAIFSSAFPVNYGDAFDVDKAKAYIGLLISAVFAYIILLIWFQISVMRHHGRPLVPFILYSVTMGILISSFTMFIPFYLIAISFGLTCLTFGLLFVIGWFSKRNLSFLGMIAMGIFFGSILILLFNLIWSLLFPETFETIYWIVSYAIFFAMLLITIADVNRIKQISQSGEQDNKLAILCAFNLYVDFIYIFIRILSIVVRIYAKSKS